MPIKMPNKGNKSDALISDKNKISAEQKADEFIRSGGTVPKAKPDIDLYAMKNFNIKITEKTLLDINLSRLARPKNPYSKKSISIQNWIIEAIEEKLEKEKRK